MPNYTRLVLKLGTSTLTAGTPHLSPPRLVELARQVAEARAQGCAVVLVSSGAMAAGRERLNFPQLPKDIPAKQMLAAVGQPRLMALYEQIFGLYGLIVAQVLLTRADLADRRRYLNSRNTFLALLAQGVIPIVNENDTVATEEIRVGDNDNLSALVANVIDADLLVLLTDQAGLFTADPRHDAAAQLITEVTDADIPDAMWQAAGGPGGGGTGGMTTKLQAADLARRSGTSVVIAQGSEPNVITRLCNGEAIGTHFQPTVTAIESRKRYILAGGRVPVGSVRVDAGAARALQKGSSLLPVGVAEVDGAFERGDTVRVTDVTGRELARGIANYSASDLARIRRRRSEDIEAVLGYHYGDEVIHRNDMVLM